MKKIAVAIDFAYGQLIFLLDVLSCVLDPLSVSSRVVMVRGPCDSAARHRVKPVCVDIAVFPDPPARQTQ